MLALHITKPHKHFSRNLKQKDPVIQYTIEYENENKSKFFGHQHY